MFWSAGLVELRSILLGPITTIINVNITLIRMILAISDLQVTLMFPTKIYVNWPFGSEEAKKKKKKFQDGGHGSHLAFWIRNILATFIYKSP